MSQLPRILYCNCAYAQVVPASVKEEVLKQLCQSGQPFEAVADLCEMAARRDSALSRLAGNPVKIAACYPRAVKWLFSAAGSPLDADQTQILNMRAETAESICSSLINPTLEPNLPAGPASIPPEAEQVPPLSTSS